MAYKNHSFPAGVGRDAGAGVVVAVQACKVFVAEKPATLRGKEGMRRVGANVAEIRSAALERAVSL